ncbi:hypothetical protein EUX98_g4131 [Antrodiella citrinella]|uniref:Pentacotripeptide-repeat region of PRORP domain-containing protein n=1 Tax=Antrodiella citrinella TaxID=2447956 RepID=A0A4S4MUY3_9APHY|nr:hypothetical protein EUX98_g4131 [Antrodiella citrinella]
MNDTGVKISRLCRPKHATIKTQNDQPTSLERVSVEEHAILVDALYALLLEGKLEKDCAKGAYQRLLSLLRYHVSARNLALSMIDTSRPQRSLHVVRLAHHLGCRCKQSLYENIAHALATARKWTLVVEIVELGRELTGRTSVRLLNWRLRGLMELGRFAEVEHVAQEFSNDMVPNRLSFHLLISAHLRNRNLPQARAYLARMEQAQIPINASTHALVAVAYRSLGHDAGVQARALSSLPDLDGRGGTVVLNSLIRMAMDRGDLSAAVEYMSFLEDPSRGLEPHLLDGVGSTHRGDETTHSPPVARIPVPGASRISPDVATFTMLVEHLGRTRQLPRIALVVQRMQAVGVSPDEKFAEVLVRAYALGGDIAKAVHLVFSVCSHAPSARPLFLQLGLDPLAKPDILLSDIKPTARIFNALLQGILEPYSLSGMRILSQAMAALEIDPDETFVETVLNYMARTAKDKPWQLILGLKKLTKTVPVSLRHALVVLGTIVRQESAWIRKGTWYATLAKHQSNRLTAKDRPNSSAAEDRISTSSPSFDPVGGLVPPKRPGYISLFRPILENLVSHGVRSDRAAMALRIRHDGVVKRDMAMAERSYQQMLDRGMHPNLYHFTALMQGYVQAGDMDSARNAMAASAKAGYPPDLVMYTSLLTGYAYMGQPLIAARTFQKMVTAGISPDGKIIGVLANAYAAVGELSTAKRVLMELWHYVGPLPAEAGELGYKDLLHAFQTAVATRTPSRDGLPLLRTKERRAIRWKLHMQLWRIIIPRLQRMNPDVTWSKRSQVATKAQQRKMARRRKQRDVLAATTYDLRFEKVKEHTLNLTDEEHPVHRLPAPPVCEIFHS